MRRLNPDERDQKLGKVAPDGVIVREQLSPLPNSIGFFSHFGDIWSKSR
jgi:hypothetical protein